jgi:hypothetical protein
MGKGGINMDDRDSTTVLYDMFERGITDEWIERYTKYELNFIKHQRYLYNKFTKEE